MKKILMILFFVSVSMFSFGQVLVTESFNDVINTEYYAKADIDITNDKLTNLTIDEKYGIYTTIEYDAYFNTFTWSINSDKEFYIDNVKVYKKTYNNGVIDYIVKRKAIKEANNHVIYVPWTFRFRITPDNKMMVISHNFNIDNIKEFLKDK